MKRQEVWKPEKQAVVDKLEETKCKGVVGNHGNFEGINKGNGLGSLVFLDGFSSLGQFLFLGFVLCLTDLDFGGDDSLIVRIGNKLNSDKGKKDVGKGRNKKSPPVSITSVQNVSSDQSSGNIAKVLMAGPETEDSTTVLDRFGITEPVTHDGSSDGTSGGLEEPKKEQNGEETNVGKGDTDGDQIQKDDSGHDDQAGTTSPKTNGKNGSRVEGITELSVDNISSSISEHESCVHSRENGRRVSGRVLKLLLNGGVTLSGQMSHEISAEGNKEGKTVCEEMKNGGKKQI